MRIRILLLLISASTILLSCGGNNSETADMKAVGGKIYGGQFSFMSGEKIESLFPLSVSDVFSNRIMSQIFEPLLKIDIATMKVEPLLAESFKVSKDATVFTLKIRQGVFFHDDQCFGGKGRELKVEDVKYSLDMACAGMEENEISYLLVNKIKGAKEFNQKNKTLDITKEGVSGIKIINSNTIEIKLKQPFVGFDKILSHNSLGIYPKEAIEKYGKEIKTHPVGTGAFSLETFNDEQIVLKRNPNYWGKDEFGNKLPFLDKVLMTYTKNKKSELLAFRKQKIDVVLEIPVEDIQDIFGSLEEAQSGKNVKHRVETEISLKMAYISFANESKEFKDERVRKAFNLAIDRQGIIQNSLEGEGYAALNGFVPSINTYPSDKVKGYVFNPTLAKKLLAQAGFPNGSKFPSLEIYVNTKEGSGVHKMVKGVVADLKKNLNVNLKIKLCSIQERNEAIHSGKAKMWRAGWIADYPDPENFLCLFYGGNISENDGSVVNDFKFSNKEFDQLFEKSLRELNIDKRNELMVKCDQLVIDHAAVMPILTDDFIVMVNVRVKDLKTNPLQALDFSRIYIKKQR
jgi:oligopeptide transport system substrate-binding protein